MGLRTFRINKPWYICPILSSDTPLLPNPQARLTNEMKITCSILEEDKQFYRLRLLKLNDKECQEVVIEVLKELVEFI